MRRGDQFFNPHGRQATPRRVNTFYKVGPSSAGTATELDPSITSFEVDTSTPLVTGSWTATLPIPSDVPAGHEVTVKDVGAGAATDNILIQTVSGTIEAPATISTNGGWRTYMSDGVSKWSLVSRDASGGGSPGGSDTQVQYNSSGAFAGDANFTYDPTGFAGSPLLTLSTGAMSVPALSVADVAGTATSLNFSANGYIGLSIDASTTPATVTIGDAGDSQNSNGVKVNDNAQTVLIGNFYGTQLIVDNTAQKATFNKPFQFDGDIILTATSGAPADTPATRTMRYDAGTDKIWIYNGAAWKSVTLT